MYRRNRTMTILTLLFYVLTSLLPTFIFNSQEAFAATGDKLFDIIEITDFHGTLEDTSGNPVAAVMSKNIKDVVYGNPDRTLIVSGGDNYQGSGLSNLLKGEPVMSVFNNLGVAVSCLGNHDFDWGIDTVTKNVYPSKANYPSICSNMFYKGTNNYVFDPYKIFIKDGVKIAVVGAITEDNPNIVLADYVKDYDFRNIVDNVRQAAIDAKANGAQIVIALIHAGDNLDSQTGPIFDVANQLGGAGGYVDAVLGGHVHDIVKTKVANGTPVAIANYNGKGFVDLQITRHSNGTLTFNTPSYIAEDTTSTVSPYGYKASHPTVDQAVYDIINAAKIQVGPILNDRLGTADIDLNRDQAHSPYGESLVGNWSSDVMKAAASTDFAFQNNGGFRIDIPQGDITMGTMYAFMPFDNTITTANMTGAQIKTLLEQAVCDGGKGIQLAGLTFTYNPSLSSGSRVVSINKSDGTPVDMTNTVKTYKVATNNFMSTGGDGFAVYNTVTSLDTNIPVRDALANSIKQAGHITAQVEGRIKNAAETPIVWVGSNYNQEGCDGHVWNVTAFNNITSAVNAVVYGGIINIEAGSYNENVTVVTDALSINAAVGAVLNSQSGTALKLNANDIKVSGLSVNGGTIGIEADGNNISLSNVKVTGCTDGLILAGSTDILKNSTITGNSTGITVNAAAYGCTVQDNAVSNNNIGLKLDKASIVTGNTVVANDTANISKADGVNCDTSRNTCGPTLNGLRVEDLKRNANNTVPEIKLTYEEGGEVSLNGSDYSTFVGGNGFKTTISAVNIDSLGFGSFTLKYDSDNLQAVAGSVYSLLPATCDVFEKTVDSTTGTIRFSFALKNGMGNLIPDASKIINIAEIKFTTKSSNSTQPQIAKFSYNDQETKLSRKTATSTERLLFYLNKIDDLNIIDQFGVDGSVGITFKDWIMQQKGFKISLEKDGSVVNSIYTTNASTAYSFSGLKSGTYALKVSGLGYKTSRQSINLVPSAANPYVVAAVKDCLAGDIVIAGSLVIGSDGLINTDDLAKICSKYRATVDWNSAPDELKACDLDRNGMVTIDDVAYVVINWCDNVQ